MNDNTLLGLGIGISFALFFINIAINNHMVAGDRHDRMVPTDFPEDKITYGHDFYKSLYIAPNFSLFALFLLVNRFLLIIMSNDNVDYIKLGFFFLFLLLFNILILVWSVLRWFPNKKLNFFRCKKIPVEEIDELYVSVGFGEIFAKIKSSWHHRINLVVMNLLGLLCVTLDLVFMVVYKAGVLS